MVLFVFPCVVRMYRTCPRCVLKKLNDGVSGMLTTVDQSTSSALMNGVVHSKSLTGEEQSDSSV